MEPTLKRTLWDGGKVSRKGSSLSRLLGSHLDLTQSGRGTYFCSGDVVLTTRPAKRNGQWMNARQSDRGEGIDMSYREEGRRVGGVQEKGPWRRLRRNLRGHGLRRGSRKRNKAVTCRTEVHLRGPGGLTVRADGKEEKSTRKRNVERVRKLKIEIANILDRGIFKTTIWWTLHGADLSQEIKPCVKNKI